MFKRFIALCAVLATVLQCGIVYAVAEDEEIIIDNNDSGFSTAGSWTTSTYTPGFYKTNYLTDNTAGEDADTWAMWTPDLPGEGEYAVYMWWPSDTNRTQAAPVEIKHKNGIEESITLNQRQFDGEWAPLGIYTFEAGTNSYVKLYASAAGYTMADAVKFVPYVKDPFEGLHATPEFEDVKGTAYEKAVKLLATLGIIEGTTETEFEPEKELTRAEMAVIAAKLFNMNALGTGTGTPFVDVDAAHYAAPYISAAVTMGLISGDGEYFYPEEYLTYEQAAKILVCALGRQIYSQFNIPYPDGYWKLANDSGILKGVSVRRTDTAIRGNIARMVLNTLEADILQLEKIGEAVSFNTVKGENILNQYLDIEKGTGQITETDKTGLYEAGSNLAAGYVRIDDRLFLCGKTDIAAHLGETVDYYYLNGEKAGGENIVLYYEPRQKSSARTITVAAKDIDRAEFSYGAITLYYYEGKTLRKQKISSAVNLVYNGKMLEEYTEQSFKPQNGSVTLVLNDNGICDIVKVLSYRTVVVDAVYPSSGTVQDKYSTGQGFQYDTEDSDIWLDITRDGNKIRFSEIKEGDVLSIAESADKKLIEIKVSDKSVFGRLISIETDGDGRKIALIDERRFDIAPDSGAIYESGMECVFYLDFMGQLAAVEDTPPEGLALLRGVYYDEGEETIQFKLMTATGKTARYANAAKVKFNNVSYSNMGELYEAIQAQGIVQPDRISYEQVVEVKFNGDGLVNRLQTAGTETFKELYTTGVAKTLTYRRANSSFQHSTNVAERVYPDANTVIFKVPKNNIEIDSEYAAADMSYFISDRNYEFITFNESEYKIPEVLLVYQDDYTGTSVNNSSEVMLIKNTKLGLDADDEIVRIVEGCFAGKETSIILSEHIPDTFFDSLKSGDLIRFNRNKSEEISGVVQAFDYNDIQKTEVRKAQLTNNYLHTAFGTVAAFKNDKLVLTTYDANLETMESVWDVSNAGMNVYIYDAKSRTARIGDIGDVSAYDLVFLQYSNFKALAMVIYKNV